MAGDCGHLDLNPPPGCEYEWWVVAATATLTHHQCSRTCAILRSRIGESERERVRESERERKRKKKERKKERKKESERERERERERKKN